MNSGHFEGTPLMYLESVFFGITMFVILYFIVIICVMVYRTKTLCCDKIIFSSSQKSLKNIVHTKKSSRISLKIYTVKLKTYIFETINKTKKFYGTKILPRFKTLCNKVKCKSISIKKIVLERFQEIKKSK